MTYPAVHSQLKVAERLSHPLRNVLHEALALAKATRCPPSCLAALTKAYTDAQALWLHVGNVEALFREPADPPTE